MNHDVAIDAVAPEEKPSGVQKVLRFLLWLSLIAGAAAAIALASSQWGQSKAESAIKASVVKRGDVVHRTQATGRVVPREEVFVRSLVAGVLVELRVQAGQRVRRGEHLATIKIVADPVALSDARAQVRAAEARFQSASRELDRVKNLLNSTGLSGRELANTEDEKRLAQDALSAVQERLTLISQGTSGTAGARSTRIVAPVDGTVLALPVALGDFVSETNSYRDGTTLAIVADMGKLLFKGQIEEAHVGRLRVGMPATVRIGALPGVSSRGKLTWIAPRATVEQTAGGSPASGASALAPLSASSAGITRFELWVELLDAPSEVRAGYSAAAELELESRSNVLVIDEGALRFEGGGKAFAHVRGTDGKESERQVRVGVSDGMRIEVLGGLSEGDQVVPKAEPEKK